MGLATLRDWQVARTQLDRALDTFLDVCSALHLARYDVSSEIQKFVYDRVDLVTAMEHKMAKSAALLRQVRNTSSIVVPINRLPLEILARTFAFCLPPFPCDTTERNPHPLFLITQVCAQWRRVASTTPSLWSQIMIDNNDSESPPKHVSVLKQTRIWLDRANGVPLSVHLQMRTNEDAEKVTDILLPHLPRIARLSFFDVIGSFIVTLLRLLWEETKFDALSALDIVWLSDNRPLELNQTKWTAIHNLQELSLLHLHRIDNGGLQPRDLATILVNSPNLRILRLHEINFQPADLSGHPNINLPSLRRLEITLGTHDNGLRALLSILRPCQLELDVVLAVPGGHGDETISSLQALLRGSNAVTLDIHFSKPYTHELLAEYLDCVPNIHTFTLGPVVLDLSFASILLPRRLNKILLRDPDGLAIVPKDVAARLVEKGVEIIYME